MEEALGLITSFIQTEMDGTRAREMAWEAVKKWNNGEKGEGDKQPGPVASWDNVLKPQTAAS